MMHSGVTNRSNGGHHMKLEKDAGIAVRALVPEFEAGISSFHQRQTRAAEAECLMA
jgi:hypothetical protein